MVFGCSVFALVAVASLALELVPGSAKPTLVGRADSGAPTPPKSKVKQAAKSPKVQTTVKPKAAPKAKSRRVPTRTSKGSTPPVSATRQAGKPKAPAAVKVERVFSWRVYRGAAYYHVYLQRGGTTVYQVRTSKRTASIRLELRPGRYHAVVRPAMSTDAGIILGPPIMDKIVRV